MNQIKVNVIRRKGATTLVQYANDDGIQRVSIPSTSVNEGDLVDELELSLGIPYGLPWEEIVKFGVTPEKLAAEFRKRGIWTLDDLTSDMQGAVGALLAVYGVDALRLLRLAKQYQNSKGG